MTNRRNQRALRAFTSIAKAVADENRIRILASLKDHELCVCQIVELLGLAPSTVSKHLSILKQAYLVDSRKDGRWTYYLRPVGDIPPAVDACLTWVDRSLEGDSKVQDDALNLKSILKKPLEDICRAPRKS